MLVAARMSFEGAAAASETERDDARRMDASRPPSPPTQPVFGGYQQLVVGTRHKSRQGFVTLSLAIHRRRFPIQAHPLLGLGSLAPRRCHEGPHEVIRQARLSTPKMGLSHPSTRACRVVRVAVLPRGVRCLSAWRMAWPARNARVRNAGGPRDLDSVHQVRPLDSTTAVPKRPCVSC